MSAWGAAEAKRTESSVPSPSVERPVMADSPRRPDLSRITAVQSAHKKPLVPERPPRLFPSSGATPCESSEYVYLSKKSYSTGTKVQFCVLLHCWRLQQQSHFSYVVMAQNMQF